MFFLSALISWVVFVSLAISWHSQSCSLSDDWRAGSLSGYCLQWVCVCQALGGARGVIGGLARTRPGAPSPSLDAIWSVSAPLISLWEKGTLFSFSGHISFMMKSIFILYIMTDSSSGDSSPSQFSTWSVAFHTSKAKDFQSQFETQKSEATGGFSGWL